MLIHQTVFVRTFFKDCFEKKTELWTAVFFGDVLRHQNFGTWFDPRLLSRVLRILDDLYRKKSPFLWSSLPNQKETYITIKNLTIYKADIFHHFWQQKFTPPRISPILSDSVCGKSHPDFYFTNPWNTTKTSFSGPWTISLQIMRPGAPQRSSQQKTSAKNANLVNQHRLNL